ncbi:NADP-dependent malic enzyme [Candidatus Saccharibacteria bacterium]|nr:NADP-dependent malic enzyme [Candidatus Saccharibacteria bacterium]
MMKNDYDALALDLHRKLKGKLSIIPKLEIKDQEDLSTVYTPGVGAVSKAISEDASLSWDLTSARQTIGIISNGSAVLGLGNIGAAASLPVMEGKALLLKQFAGVDAWPLVIDADSVDQMFEIIMAVAPNFGAINLEDIRAPECFELERRLIEHLDIAVMHDDQHGTAIVVLAGLINASKVVNKDINQSRVVILGAGAAGQAIARLIVEQYPDAEVLVVDREGIIYLGRPGLRFDKADLAKITNKRLIQGQAEVAIKGSDILIGVSGPGSITPDMVKTMADQAIIFALANPIPEIDPGLAKQAGAMVVATGRSDYPNQVNNALAFPGIFKGVLEYQIKRITSEHKLAAAREIASFIEDPDQDLIIPSVFQLDLVDRIAKAIGEIG